MRRARRGGQSLCGAAWLGAASPGAGRPARRLQAGGVASAASPGWPQQRSRRSGLQTRLSRWLAWVQGLRWTQADLLQVMEELEPHALAALQNYFLLRVGLNAVAPLSRRGCPNGAVLPSGQLLELTLGVQDLPSVAMSEAVIEAARRPPPIRGGWRRSRDAATAAGEIRPDALRWPDAPELLSTWPTRATAGRRPARRAAADPGRLGGRADRRTVPRG